MKRQIRIIGGKWRGRKVNFADQEDLRPTPDRVRETLFNWLTQDIHNLRCLDLFAGSGALGIEALSRGAAHTDFLDTHRANLNAIGSTLDEFGEASFTTIQQDAIQYLASADTTYDLVFLDPPFQSDLLGRAMQELFARNLVSEYIYVESPSELCSDLLPKSWVIHRQKRAGQSHYALLQSRNSPV